MKFARNFKALRRKMGITQEIMAERCGVSRGALAKWESGSTIPNLYMVDEIAKFFGISIDELLHGEIENAHNNSIDVFFDKLDKLKEEILSEIRKKGSDLDAYELYESFRNNQKKQFDDAVPADAYSYLGVEAAEKGEYEEALKYFEEALVRGEIQAIDCIMGVYRDILDMYMFEDDETDYYRYRLQQAQKMQQYGKIIESEIREEHNI